ETEFREHAPVLRQLEPGTGLHAEVRVGTIQPARERNLAVVEAEAAELIHALACLAVHEVAGKAEVRVRVDRSLSVVPIEREVATEPPTRSVRVALAAQGEVESEVRVVAQVANRKRKATHEREPHRRLRRARARRGH